MVRFTLWEVYGPNSENRYFRKGGLVVSGTYRPRLRLVVDNPRSPSFGTKVKRLRGKTSVEVTVSVRTGV